MFNNYQVKQTIILNKRFGVVNLKPMYGSKKFITVDVPNHFVFYNKGTHKPNTVLNVNTQLFIKHHLIKHGFNVVFYTPSGTYIMEPHNYNHNQKTITCSNTGKTFYLTSTQMEVGSKPFINGYY